MSDKHKTTPAAVTPTAARLRELFSFDAEAGMLRRIAGGKNRRVGETPGHIDAHGHRVIMVDGKYRRAHHIVWCMHYGSWPDFILDHINGAKDDNRICNLRRADHQINNENRREPMVTNKSCGVLGVTRGRGKSKPWVASIRSHGKQYYLGAFATTDEAHQVYVDAKRRLHKGCTL